MTDVQVAQSLDTALPTFETTQQMFGTILWYKSTFYIRHYKIIRKKMSQNAAFLEQNTNIGQCVG